MKRYLLFIVLVLGSLTALAKPAKYVFYFIGDGMGVNHVNLTETYLAAIEGRIGFKPLLFSSFPYSAYINTYSATNGVTDSAASGTALASGHKTYNRSIGLATDTLTEISSIADRAKRAGFAVGVATSVSIDHATPAAFYAHVPDRDMYYEIGTQLGAYGYDFMAGSDFLKPRSKKVLQPSPDLSAETPRQPLLYDLVAEQGYTIARGFDDYKSKANAQKLLLLQTESASAARRVGIPFAIDRREGDNALKLTDITKAGIEFLSHRAAKQKGFFLMVEGGQIDWTGHNNDAAALVNEIKDFDDAIRQAYEFYLKHPDETLIVVTADHETGGLALGTGAYKLRSDYLQYQRLSVEAYSEHLKALMADGKLKTWDNLKADLMEHFGFWREVPLSEHQTVKLHAAFADVLRGSEVKTETLYANLGQIANTACAVMAECAQIHWGTGGHTNGYVPVYAIGAGAEQFHGRMDNIEIAPAIAKAMRLK